MGKSSIVTVLDLFSWFAKLNKKKAVSVIEQILLDSKNVQFQ